MKFKEKIMQKCDIDRHKKNFPIGNNLQYLLHF